MTVSRIPAGTQTYSKGPAQFPEGLGRAVRGDGGHLWTDTHGELIDWVMGLGAFPLGYRDPDVDAAIVEQLALGTEFSLPHALEEEVASLIAERFPGVEQVKFGKNGSDVTSAAIRAARALSGRERVASYGYHGWHDWSCPNERGIPLSFRSDIFIESADWHRDEWTNDADDYAALIVEPDGLCGTVTDLREFCSQHGVVLIFDEVVTGMRWKHGSVAKHVGVTPDLICLGKAIANGMPLSAVAGSARFMEPFAGAIGYSMTHGGECLSLAAGAATLRKMDANRRERIWSIGHHLSLHFNELAVRSGLPLRAGGSPCRVVIDWPEDRRWRTAVQEMLLDEGILLAYGFIPCVAHTVEDVDRTVAALERCFVRLADEGPRPHGRLVAEPYRQ